MEVGDEKEGRDEESKDVTESPGAMSSENSAAIENLMEAETEEGGEDKKLENFDTKRSKVEDGESKNVVDIESQGPRAPQEEKKKESFRFSAAVSSIWIPSVVGDQKQKFFLKAGEDKTFAGFSSSNEIFQE